MADKDIRNMIEDDAAAVEEVIYTDDTSNIADLDNTIDEVVDAIDDVDFDENHEDGEDIDTVEGLEDEEIELQVETEDDAAELELITDMESTDDIEEDVDAELYEAFHIIDTDLIMTIQEATEEYDQD